MVGKIDNCSAKALAVASCLLLSLVSQARAHDYPTEVIGDYLFACMASNGQTQEALKKCACSMDVISSIVSHEDYAEAETFMSMRQVRGGGEKMALFRETKMAKEAVDKLKRAQIEAEIRCF
ncbi:MAG: hypothetical protein ACR2QH_05185 [Geminicoccaceae bacterium]